MWRWLKSRTRLVTQIAFTALSNAYIKGFASGTIYKGPLKAVCVPGLSCYSCPGALGSCPIGALQAALTERRVSFPYYVAGMLLLFGAVFGRWVCGFLCPFGLYQDLLHRIPVKKWHGMRTRLDRMLRWLKFVVLAVFVIWLPLFAVNAYGIGTPWFCKYLCPSGMLMGGIPLLALSEQLRSQVSFLFGWKFALLMGFSVWSAFFYRPFCKYLCPLGAIYGLFNRIAPLAYRVDPKACTHCGRCAKVCPMHVDLCREALPIECIQCGECARGCPEGAIGRGRGAAARGQKQT